MKNLFSKNFNNADEVKTPPKARVEILKLGNVTASKLARLEMVGMYSTNRWGA
jgi:hypothetical protein